MSAPGHRPSPDRLARALSGVSTVEETRRGVGRLLAGASPEVRREIAEELLGVERPEPTSAEGDGWPAAPFLPGLLDPDPLPVDVLPSVLRAHVASVAGATQTPPDLGAMLALASVSAAVRGRAYW